MIQQTQLIETIVQELAKSAPYDWDSFVFYTELLRDPELGLRNRMIDGCWIGQDKIPFDTSRGPAIEHNGKSIDALEDLFTLAESENQVWCGFGLLVNHEGKFKSIFYYEGTPMLNNNDNREDDKRDQAIKNARIEEIRTLFKDYLFAS